MVHDDEYPSQCVRPMYAVTNNHNLFENAFAYRIVRSAWRQPNISISCDLVLKIFLNVLFMTYS